jgi:hypothetical protein
MAIAFDATSDSGYQTTAIYSWSHTCTGLNLILFVAQVNTGTPSNVNYGGQALTQIAAIGAGITLWYLINPPSGSHTVSITNQDNPSGAEAFAISYTGAAWYLDSHAVNAGFSTSPTTSNTTVVNSNCWLLGIGLNRTTSTPTMSQNYTLRQTTSGSISYGIAILSDTNGTVGTGTQGITYTGNFAGNEGNTIVASIAPFPPPASPSNFLLATL